MTLLPCPFCGVPPFEEHFPTLHIIQCESCGIRMYGKGIMSDATTTPHDDRGTVSFTGPGTLAHQEALRKRWNTRYS